MNKEKILALATHLSHLPDAQFDMEETLCGTVGCIAGHAVLLFGVKPTITNGREIIGQARRLLDLTDHQADQLFMGYGILGENDVPLNLITREDAVTTLYNFSQTGKIEWNIR